MQETTFNFNFQCDFFSDPKEWTNLSYLAYLFTTHDNSASYMFQTF